MSEPDDAWRPPQPDGRPVGPPPQAGPPEMPPTMPPGMTPGAPPPMWPPAPPPNHPSATTALVLGILGLVVCGIAAPFALSTGRRAVREIDASNGQLGGRDTAQVGFVLGVVGTVILGLGVLFLLVMVFVFGVLGVGAMTSSGFTNS